MVKALAIIGLVAACRLATDEQAIAETLYTESPPVWFEAHRVFATILHPQVPPAGRHIAATRIVQSKEIRRMPLP